MTPVSVTGPAPVPGSAAWAERVAAGFEAAARRYDSAARVQRRTALALADLLAQEQFPEAPKVLEIGCGTGFLTEALLPRLGPDPLWLATDIAPAMVDLCLNRLRGQEGLCGRAMDAQAPDLPPEAFDLVCGNLVVQWFSDLPGSLHRLFDLVRPGGLLAVTTLGSDTFHEWRAACAAVGEQAATPNYPEAEALAVLAQPGGEVLRQAHTLFYEDAHAFLRSLKTIGAHTPPPGRRATTPGGLRRVLRHVGDAESFSVTYDVLTLLWRKEPAP